MKLLRMVKIKDLLTLQDLSPAEILGLIKLTRSIKGETATKQIRGALFGKHVVLLFQKPSTRTRVSFEVAIEKLGGSSTFLASREAQLSRGETVADTAKVLSQYADAIVARVYQHAFLIEMAKHADVPVVNALSDLYHPVQVLSDLFTIQEARGRLRGVKLAYIGDGNNVCNSLLLGCSKVGIDLRVACPKEYEPPKGVVEKAYENARMSGSSVKITRDPLEACKDVEAVYTDTFISMGDEDERETRLKAFLPRYRVTPEFFKVAERDAIFLHCLPAHRGEEVAAEVIDGPNSMVWTQARNRVYTQQALLAALLG
ncbi:MAG: ornithine carbamoyltransferase [Candidatus Bathyarchaeia archaeon]